MQSPGLRSQGFWPVGMARSPGICVLIFPGDSAANAQSILIWKQYLRATFTIISDQDQLFTQEETHNQTPIPQKTNILDLTCLCLGNSRLNRAWVPTAGCCPHLFAFSLFLLCAKYMSCSGKNWAKRGLSQLRTANGGGVCSWSPGSWDC